MNDNVKKFIKTAIFELIQHTSDKQKISASIKRHTNKVHFIPIRYRIFGGLLQSMNIQFGNFIEKLLHIIVQNEDNLNVVDNISGSRKISLSITQKSELLIDKYVTDCQNSTNATDEILNNFNSLIQQCLNIENNTQKKEINIKHDIDVLFQDVSGKYYYLEVKYNDDHDTGKYADINRKFIKTYIGICNLLGFYDENQIKPILYYLTQKRMKGNIYLPEQENIYRGEKLFKEFFSIEYSELDILMKNIGNDNDVMELFDNLYKQIRHELNL